MTDLNQRLQELFLKIIDRPLTEWPAFVDENCELPELRNRLQELLDAHIRSGAFLDKPAIEAYANLAFPLAGQIDQFRIIRLIGQGGAGQVYLAEDTVLNRLVALKVIGHFDTSIDCNAENLVRFQREARAGARLVHPSIVKVHQTGETGGYFYIAMEYVEGTTLREWIESEAGFSKVGTTQRFQTVAKLISQIADATDCAHRAGVVHRDIKPSNILIDAEGNARLADFGIAQINSEKTEQRPGVILGSCPYMSPEQARILDVDIDHRTDIFSLGVVLYEAISRKRPFEGETFPDVLKALTDCRPMQLKRIVSSVPHDLAVICHKAIEKDVNDRYQSAAHLFADLQCFLAGRPILACPPSYGRRIRSWAKSHYRFALIGAIGILVSSLIALGVLYKTQEISAEAEKKRALALELSQMGLLSVLKKHSGAKVWLSRISDELKIGQAILIGTAPTSKHLDPGLYRVILDDGQTKLEATSLIDAGTVDEIEVNSPLQEVIAGLVEIPGRQYELGDEDSTYPLSSLRQSLIPTFRISPTEVSNREYREFVVATKRPPPYWWANPYDEKIDDLPVTGITWDEANLYCRWRGVRLTTPDEWEATARGPNRTRFPWGNDRNDNIIRQELEKLDVVAYRKFARPVKSDPHLATPLGVKHMFSNVQEYTEGIAVDNNRGLVLKGRSWSDFPFCKLSDVPIFSGRRLRSINLGFRVSLSINTER
ncbi:MAG: bifunctional serine/threonine-protein kinase/formylglycine-generating enzyme family protein [Planctomycetota bacterium]|nr:bifunctional serine/threonine-protein kinase/formylglycine-generating enzyme family protein [Planctomycetota bacterium]